MRMTIYEKRANNSRERPAQIINNCRSDIREHRDTIDEYDNEKRRFHGYVTGKPRAPVVFGVSLVILPSKWRISGDRWAIKPRSADIVHLTSNHQVPLRAVFTTIVSAHPVTPAIVWFIRLELGTSTANPSRAQKSCSLQRRSKRRFHDIKNPPNPHPYHLVGLVSNSLSFVTGTVTSLHQGIGWGNG